MSACSFRVPPDFAINPLMALNPGLVFILRTDAAGAFVNVVKRPVLRTTKTTVTCWTCGASFRSVSAAKQNGWNIVSPRAGQCPDCYRARRVGEL